MIRALPTLRAGIDIFTRHLPLLLGSWLVILAAQQAIALLIPDGTGWNLLQSLLTVVTVGPLYAGQYWIALRIVREEPTSIRELFHGFSRWGSLVGVSLLTSLAVGIGFLLLVVPGIVWALALLFGPICVLDGRKPDGTPTKTGTFDALQESQDITKGYKGALFRVAFIFAIPTVILAVFNLLYVYVPGFPIPYWAIQMLSLLAGTFFLSPISAVCYMIVYDKITGLRRVACEVADSASERPPPPHIPDIERAYYGRDIGDHLPIDDIDRWLDKTRSAGDGSV